MMPDIFSSFDSSEFNTLIPMNFMFLAVTMVIILYIQSLFWYAPSWSITSSVTALMTIFSQLVRTSSKIIKGFSLIITTLFLILILINLMGMIPYTFSVSTHLIFTLVLGLPLWLSLIMSSMVNNPKAFVAHFLPDGAPLWLNPFLVLIETTSIAVRPMTLSFRLAANMSAGHIVLSLIGIYLTGALFSSVSSTIILTLLSSGYILFELAICLIQAYIFCLLLSLYSDDHSHSSSH